MNSCFGEISTNTKMAKILTVDDSVVIRTIIQRMLEPLGCQITQATNGQEGLEAAVNDRPDLILLDITMPVLDGIATLERLRSEPTLSTIPVIMLTAESSQENVARADQLGVSGYIAKPFTHDNMLEKIRTVLAI